MANTKFPLTLEQVLTSPKLWNLPTATPVQRAKCRIVEGLPVGELATHPDVLEMCGGVVPNLSEPPSELLDISAIRIGKSLFAAALLFWMSQTVDLRNTRESDIVSLFVVALKIGGTSAVIKHLIEPLTKQPALRPFLVDDPKDITIGSVQRSGLRLKRPHDNRIVEVQCIPLDRGGGSALSVYCAGLVVDEYPRMIGAEDGVRNVEHFRDGVQGRTLPGAVQLYTGSPWQPYGPAYDNTIKFFGKPSQDLVVLRTSARTFIGLGDWSQKKADRLQRVNATAYKTDFLAEFADGEEAVFPAQAIDDAFLRSLEPNVEYGQPAIFADPSALRHDYWAALVGAWAWKRPTDEDLYEVEELGEFITPAAQLQGRGMVVPGRNGWVRVLEDRYGRRIPKKEPTATLRPFFKVFDIVSWNREDVQRGARGLDLVKAVGAMGRKYGCEDFHFDGYEQLMLGDMIRREGLRPIVHTWSGANRKTHAVDHLRTLFVERRMDLPQHDLLKQELVRFRSRATPGGNFSYEVAGGGGHGDHASCLTLAMRADLDGFLDRSPTAMPAERNEILDHGDADRPSYAFAA